MLTISLLAVVVFSGCGKEAEKSSEFNSTSGEEGLFERGPATFGEEAETSQNPLEKLRLDLSSGKRSNVLIK